MQSYAIHCSSSHGPKFGSDISVHDHCNANTDNCFLAFGNIYTNDTGMDGETFFTGSKNLKVKEIEVFEIAK
jgi:hypothetical protein